MATPTALSTRSITTANASTKQRTKGERVSWSTTVILLLCAVTVLLPLYVTISMAFKTDTQSVDGNAFSLPAPFSIDGFVQAWTLTKFPVGFAMSLLVTAGTVVATIILASFAAYAIVRNWDRRLFRFSFFYLLAAMFIPFPVVALPQIQLTGRVGLDNPFGVIILATMFQLSFSVLLFTAFLRSIPIELEESARIDGASTWQTFWHR
jgi:raffinose/stachyose/melibiose transport system permease protein